MSGSPIHCSLCGQESILLKAWEEKLETRQGISLIKHEQYICPDPICQKKVDLSNRARRALAKERERASLEREANRNSSRIAVS